MNSSSYLLRLRLSVASNPIKIDPIQTDSQACKTKDIDRVIQEDMVLDTMMMDSILSVMEVVLGRFL